MMDELCKLPTDIDRLLQDDGAFGEAAQQSGDNFPMNLMSNETITWAVERERGMSCDFTALCDVECKADLQAEIKREIKLEHEDEEIGTGDSASIVSKQERDAGQPHSFLRNIPTKRVPPTSNNEISKGSKRQAIPLVPFSGRAHTRSQAQAALRLQPTTHKGLIEKERCRSPSGRKDRTVKRSKNRENGVDIAALTAELGLVDARHYNGRRGLNPHHRVGAYTLAERAVILSKFHAKRGRRIWRKKIKYDCRKKLADKRPRLRGRFVTQEELNTLDEATLAKVTGLGTYEADSSDAEDSDDSEESSGRAYTRCRARGSGRRSCKRDSPDRDEQPHSRESTRSGLRGRRPAAGIESCSKRVCVGKSGAIKKACGGQATKVQSVEDSADVVTVTADTAAEEFFDVEDMLDVEAASNDSDEDSVDNIRQHREDPVDLVHNFMVDDIISNNFAFLHHNDIVSAGVPVN